MNGVVCRGLKELVVEYYGQPTWLAVHERAGLAPRLYVPATDYPDDLVRTLVDATVSETGVEREALLSALGHAIAPDLLEIYGVHVRDEWTTLDIVANVERLLHDAFTANRFTSFEPPRVRSESVGERTQLVHYASGRGGCALFEGVLEGLGDHYDEHLLVDHRECAHDGADGCAVVVTRREEPPGSATDATGIPDGRADPLAE